MSPKLIIDMRCLQDRHQARRCIGLHASCVIGRAPWPFIGLIDPDLPALPPHIADLAKSLSPHADIPDLAPGAVLLNPASLGPPDQAYLAPLLRRPGLIKAALVRDFLPFDHQESELTSPVERLKYFTAMALLRHYDLFFPISEASDQRLKSLYGAVEFAGDRCLPALLDPPHHAAGAASYPHDRRRESAPEPRERCCAPVPAVQSCAKSRW